MRTTRKILILVAVVAVMVAALVVSTSAYISWDAETSSFPNGVNSSYADINAPGWIQVAGTTTALDANDDKDYDDEGDLPKSNGSYRMYFNESTGTLVVEMKNDGDSITGGNTDYTQAAHSSYWLNANAAKITALEIRNVGHLNNAAYVWGKLTSVKTVKMTTACSAWNGSKSDTGAFVGLTAMDTLIWGTWDKATGEFTKTRGEEGVVDLGGFLYLDIMSTTYNSTHTIMYAGSAVRATGVKKLILPYSQVLRNTSRTYNKVVVSDGTYVDGNAGTSSASNSNYGKTIAAGKPCTVLVNKTTGETGYTTFWAVDAATWSTVTVKAAEDEFGGVYTGIIPYCIAYNAKSLAEVVVPAEVNLEYIEALAFAYCTSLKTINVLGSISSELVIEDKNAFTNVTGLTINVQSERDKAYMQSALANAGVEGVTVVNLNPPEATAKDDAVTADGYSIRQTDENARTKGPALRAEFTLVDSALANAGADVTDFGVIVFSADTYASYGSNIYSIFDAIGTTTKIIKKSAFNGPYVRVSDNGDITFAAAITNIPVANYQSEIYTYAYVTWSDDTTTYYTYTSENTGKTAHALYDLTVYLFKNGLANSENTDEDKLWGVLSTGAVAYEGNINSTQNSDSANYTNATHYLNNPLYAFSNYTYYWGSAADATLESTSSTNINWSIIEDGDEYIVVYRNAGGEGEALLPGVYPNYTVASHPFNPNYNRADAKTPALTSAAYQKIKTLVIDYGVDGVMINGDGALSSMTYVETIVYPNGFDEICHYKRDWGKDANDIDGDENTTEYVLDLDGDGDLYDATENNVVGYLFAYNSALKDVIWANNDKYAHMKDFIVAEGDTKMEHLYDLRGMGAWPSNNNIFDSTKPIENVVFGAAPKRAIYKDVFKHVTALQRAWHDYEHTADTQYNAPAVKTIALYTRTNAWQWGNIEGAAYSVKDNGYTLMLNSGIAKNGTYLDSTFFGGDNAATLKLKVIIVDDAGTAVSPADAIARIEARITATASSTSKMTADGLARLYFYQTEGENAGKYVNSTGTVFAE